MPAIKDKGSWPSHVKFTKAVIERLERSDCEGKQRTVWDTEQRGLCVLVSPSSRPAGKNTVTLRCLYYLDAKPRYVKIGRHDEKVHYRDVTGKLHELKCWDMDAVRRRASDIRNAAKRAKYPVQMTDRSQVDIKAGGIHAACRGELHLKLFELDRQCCRAADQRTLRLAGNSVTTQVIREQFDQVAEAPGPCRATIGTRQEGGTVGQAGSTFGTVIHCVGSIRGRDPHICALIIEVIFEQSRAVEALAFHLPALCFHSAKGKIECCND